MDVETIWLSIKLAACTTLILFLFGLPLSYWLAVSRWRLKFLLEAVVVLPMILPPTVLGFYILVAIGPKSPLGRIYEATTGQVLPFSFQGLLLASILYSLPFAVRPFTAAFSGVDRRLIEASWCLGVSRFGTFLKVVCPLAWAGILTGLVLSFAHTLGEFGVVLMVGGNVPGVTRTVSIAIYDDVQALDYSQAALTSLVLLASSFVALSVTYLLNPKGGYGA
jgi:molybdate transport system permease protein